MTPSRPPRAFSLIEVTLSLAVVSFALLAVLTLLPLGLKLIIESSQQQAKANILTQVRGQLQQLPFLPSANTGDTTSISTINGLTNYYDMTGAPINTTTQTTNSYYQATFSVSDASSYTTTTVSTNNAVQVMVYLTYPLNLPASAQKTSTNAIYTAKQIGD